MGKERSQCILSRLSTMPACALWWQANARKAANQNALTEELRAAGAYQ